MLEKLKELLILLDFSGKSPNLRILNNNNYKSIVSFIISIIIIIISIIFVIDSAIDYMNQQPIISYYKSIDNNTNKTFEISDSFLMFKFSFLSDCLREDYQEMTLTHIINGAFKMINSWLLKPVTRIEKDAEGNDIEVTIPNLYHLRNRALIQELIQWNPYKNFDRVMSLVQLILYREEKMVLYQGDMKKAEQPATGLDADSYWDKNYPGKQRDFRMSVNSY